MVLVGCSGHRVGYQASTIEQVREKQEELSNVKSPIKVFRVDGSILLFRKGASINDTAMWGTAEVMMPDGGLDTGQIITVTASEVAGATLYDFKQSPGSAVGAAFTGLLGASSWLIAISCLTDPKGCFGSCPTVYVPHRDSMIMVAEMFSTSISPSLARDDLDRLCSVDGDAPIRVLITNEALESHYIDKVQFVYVPHRPSETALPQPDGTITIGGRITLDLSATTSSGTDVTSLLAAPDGDAWRSGPERLLMLPPEDPFDHVELTVPTEDLHEVDLRLRWKNTLLSTVLFYNMVLGDQGFHALAWQECLDTDPLYSAAFSMLYNRYSGIRVQVWNGSMWEDQATLTDAGPIVWREESVTLCTNEQDTMRIRLLGLADNVQIDAVEAGLPHNVEPLETVIPWTVVSTTVPGDRDVSDLLHRTDANMLLHEPGESTALLVQPPAGARHGTIFVRSHGWYYEWVRRKWLDTTTDPLSWKMLNGTVMIRELGRRWMDEHAALEESFYQATIPLRKP